MATFNPQLRHDSVSSTSESIMTSDDRTELLSNYWPTDAAFAGPSREQGCDRPLSQREARSTVVDSKHQVYTITDDSLPSHMRSLLPSHERHVHDLLTLERTRRRLRHLIIGLSLLLTFAVLVAVTLVFTLKVKNISMETLLREDEQVSVEEMAEVETEVKVSLLDNSNNNDNINNRDDQSRLQWPRYTYTDAVEQRTPCLRECWAYAAFRFRSQCYHGYCQCYGENYNPQTCLPQYKECVIKRHSPSTNNGVASYKSQNQTTYTCRTLPSDHGNVHVISLFGNHRAPSTHVTIKGQSAGSGNLVLVSYHFVKWTVHLPENSDISNVYVIYMKAGSDSESVEFEWMPSEGQNQGQGQPKPEIALLHPDVEVHYRMSLTGYGEDKNGGHTPKLLQYIDDAIGPVTSFLGAAHADAITLDLDDLEGGRGTSTSSVTSANTSTSAAAETDSASSSSVLELS